MTTTPTPPTPAPPAPAPPQPTPQPPPPPNPGPSADDLPDDLGDAGKKAIQSERDARKAAEKAAADLQRQIDAINQANETAVEKAQREAKEAQDALAKATRQSLVQKVALDKGVPATHVHRLVGDTEAELIADADALMADLNKPGTPRPDPSQGAKPGQPAGSNDPAQAFAQFIQNATGASPRP